MRRVLRVVALIIITALAVALLLFLVWGLTPLGPTDRALAALRSDEQVSVTQGDWLAFEPTSAQPISGLILYPGGHVDYRSYAPLAHLLASRGYYVAIVPMPLSLAVFGSNGASRVTAARPGIRYWTMAGHSLGGVMAAQYASRNLDKINGIALLASYPAVDLSGSDLHGLQVYGSRDTVLDRMAVAGAASKLPPGTIRQVIEGGNHAQFGDYGAQPGDSPATISAEDQQAQVVQLLERLMRGIEGE
jgi:hypothetical protein